MNRRTNFPPFISSCVAMAPLPYLLVVLVVAASPSLAWDSAEMEMFDLVEEVNQNFYEVMDISQVGGVGVCSEGCRGGAGHGGHTGGQG